MLITGLCLNTTNPTNYSTLLPGGFSWEIQSLNKLQDLRNKRFDSKPVLLERED